MFDTCIDCIFGVAMEKTIDDAFRGMVRTCADDIGVSLNELRHLEAFCPMHEKCTASIGLALKPPKCVFVPTGNEWHPDVERAIQS